MIAVLVDSVEPQGSVSIGRGTTEDGRPVTFGGDWRLMNDLAIGIDADGPQWADVEGWQLL